MRRLCFFLLALGGGWTWAQPSLVGLARSGSAAEVRAALAAGADVHSVDEYGQTPLFYAAEHNSPEVAESLVRAGADVNARTPDGWTPLMVAFRNTAYPAMVAKLFSLGARAETVLFETYRNEALGYTLEYPLGILEPQGEFSSGDGQSFLSRNGRARMLVFSLPKTRSSLNEAFAAASADRPGRTVTYKVLRDTWFVVSGYEDDSVFYEKTLLAGDRLVTTELKYHRQLQTLFNPITSQIASSFVLQMPARAEAAPGAARSAERSPAPRATPSEPTAAPRPSSPPAPSAATRASPARSEEAPRALESNPPPPSDPLPSDPATSDPLPSDPQPSDPAPTSSAAVPSAVAPPSPPPAATPPPLPAPSSAPLAPPAAATPPPAAAPTTDPASTQFFDQALRLAGVREVSCSASVEADAAPGGLEVRCGRKRQDAVGFKSSWDRASAGVEALEALSPWQVSGGSHRRDYRQGDSRLTVIFNDGYIINEAEIILYRRSSR